MKETWARPKVQPSPVDAVALVAAAAAAAFTQHSRSYFGTHRLIPYHEEGRKYSTKEKKMETVEKKKLSSGGDDGGHPLCALGDLGGWGPKGNNNNKLRRRAAASFPSLKRSIWIYFQCVFPHWERKSSLVCLFAIRLEWLDDRIETRLKSQSNKREKKKQKFLFSSEFFSKRRRRRYRIFFHVSVRRNGHKSSGLYHITLLTPFFLPHFMSISY